METRDRADGHLQESERYLPGSERNAVEGLSSSRASSKTAEGASESADASGPAGRSSTPRAGQLGRRCRQGGLPPFLTSTSPSPSAPHYLPSRSSLAARRNVPRDPAVGPSARRPRLLPDALLVVRPAGLGPPADAARRPAAAPGGDPRWHPVHQRIAGQHRQKGCRWCGAALAQARELASLVVVD